MSDARPGEEASALARSERLAATLLRVGVLTSIAVIGLGLGVSFVHHPDYLSDPAVLARLTAPGAAFPHALADVAAELAQGRGTALVAAGLLLLIATPVLRVAASVVGFVTQRDVAFASITLAVLAVLVLSFALGSTG
jgi:uncharacterized membrane protein